jgi:RNA polymerase sigma-70 factor (ECF subfamily)
MQKPNGILDSVSVNSLTDGELLINAANGDTSAFEHLYLRYSSILYSLIKKIVSSEEISEKILMEVFLILWKRIEDFKPDTVFTGLILLARNKSLDYLRRQRENTELPEYDDDYERFRILPIISKEIKPVKLQDALKVKYEIGEMIKSLTDAQRYVMSLFYFEGLNETEISEKLKIPVQTVRSKLSVAADLLLGKSRILEPLNG